VKRVSIAFWSLLTAVGMAAVWAMATLATQRPLAWMALVSAADVVLMLSLLRLAPGLTRAALAAANTTLSIVLAWWFIAASQMAPMLGLHPLQSLQRMSPQLAFSLSAATFSDGDRLLAAASIALAALWGFAVRLPDQR